MNVFRCRKCYSLPGLTLMLHLHFQQMILVLTGRDYRQVVERRKHLLWCKPPAHMLQNTKHIVGKSSLQITGSLTKVFNFFSPVCHMSVRITQATSFCHLWIHLPLCYCRYHKLPLYLTWRLLVVWSYFSVTKMGKMQKHPRWLNTTHLSFTEW